MATITTLLNGITGLSFRTTLNNNFANLNSDKAETTALNTLQTDVETLTGEVDTNTVNLGTLDTRLTTTETNVATLLSSTHQTGFVDYNDLSTATTPISVPGTNTYVDVTNDTLGAYTTVDYLPVGVTSIWNSVTNRFDWSDLALGDTIDIRLDMEVTTTTPSQAVTVVLELATDSGAPYEILFTETSFKAAGVHKINRYNGIYLGNTLTLNNPGRFRIKSDATATAKVNGFYCKITKK